MNLAQNEFRALDRRLIILFFYAYQAAVTKNLARILRCQNLLYLRKMIRFLYFIYSKSYTLNY